MCHSGGSPKGEDRVNRSSPYVPGTRGGSTLPASTREPPSRRWSSSRVQENMTPIRPRRPGSWSVASAPGPALAEGRAGDEAQFSGTNCSHRKIRNDAAEFWNLLVSFTDEHDGTFFFNPTPREATITIIACFPRRDPLRKKCIKLSTQ